LLCGLALRCLSRCHPAQALHIHSPHTRLPYSSLPRIFKYLPYPTRPGHPSRSHLHRQSIRCVVVSCQTEPNPATRAPAAARPCSPACLPFTSSTSAHTTRREHQQVAPLLMLHRVPLRALPPSSSSLFLSPSATPSTSTFFPSSTMQQYESRHPLVRLPDSYPASQTCPQFPLRLMKLRTCNTSPTAPRKLKCHSTCRLRGQRSFGGASSAHWCPALPRAT
jgi:hypothetical protein